uniref:Uncharacterized protein n=1 Tax=Ganoderma leucocontextum TaxID=1566825 RepID=A0A2S1WBH8_9APHY|nr:hypothetical protein [Ganoderma leucocontextum]AWJ63946.1 hypothetical protein [Ganoderma leucocontextum]
MSYNNKVIFFNNFYELATVLCGDTQYPEIRILYRVDASNYPSLNHLYVTIKHDIEMPISLKSSILYSLEQTSHDFYQVNQALIQRVGSQSIFSIDPPVNYPMVWTYCCS